MSVVTMSNATAVPKMDERNRLSTAWRASDIPNLKGRIAVATGTGGLGFEDSLELARAGARVVIAGRNPKKGAEAVERIQKELPTADIQFEQLDLADLSSVRNFASRLRSKLDCIDILINNAGVMVPPKREVTVDGFELQMGTNYLGHFALTAQLMPLLREAGNPRVISLASVAARNGKLDFADLQGEKTYDPMKAYSQSKLACLMFARELQRRSDENGWNLTSIAAHPGVSRTDLLHNSPGKFSIHGLSRTFLWFLFQPASQGALPTLYAATSPDAAPGGYYGPNRMSEVRGYTAIAKVPPQALDPMTSSRLWDISQQLTRVSFDVVE